MQAMTVKGWVLFSVLGILQLNPSASAVMDFGNVQVSAIGHSFGTNLVTDSLIDQNQSSGSDGVLNPVFGFFTTGANQFELTISAPPGKQFLVHVPTDQAVRFGGRIEWTKFQGTVVPPVEFGIVAVGFSDLAGTPPDFSASQSWLTGAGPEVDSFGFYNLESTAFTNEMAFTAVTVTATVQGTGLSPMPVLQVYYPTSNSVFGLCYNTSEPNDPGPFVSIVPAPLPVVNLVSQTNGDITITFTGVLQYANDVSGSFDDVPGNPQETFTIPKASLTMHQYFRARGR